MSEALALDSEQQILDEKQVSVDDMVLIDMQALMIQGYPTTLLVDKQGNVLEAWTGLVNEERIEALIAKL